MINLYSSDNSVTINKTSDCVFDLKTNITLPTISIVKNDTNTISLIGNGNSLSPLKGNVKISSQTGNILTSTSDGLFVPPTVIPTITPQVLAFNSGNGNLSISSGNTVTIPFQQLSFDCGTKILQLTGSSSVDLTCLSQSFVETALNVTDTQSIDFTASGTSNHTLTGSVRIDGTQPNALSVNANGLYVAPPTTITETPLTVTDSSSIDFTASGTSNHTLTAAVKISATSGNILSLNSDGLFVPDTDTTSAFTFQNGLTNTSSVVGLGGALAQDTAVNTGNYFLNINTGASAGGFRINDNSHVDSYVYITNGADGRTSNVSSILRKPLYQGVSTSLSSIGASCTINNSSAISHNSTNTFNVGLYGEFGIDTGVNSVTLGTGIGKTYSGVIGTFSVFSSGAISGGMPAGGTFYSNVGGSMNIQNIASLRTFGTIQTPNTTGYSGTITNYYSLYIESLSAAGTVGNITNKYGIYQAGVNDVNRFFGDVQNAGGSIQFTSDARVKENIQSFNRGLAEIKKVIPHTYNFTYNKEKTATGLIAQELELVIPEAVSRGKFDTPKGEQFEDFRFIDQNVLFYTLVNAIKELAYKVELLEMRNNG